MIFTANLLYTALVGAHWGIIVTTAAHVDGRDYVFKITLRNSFQKCAFMKDSFTYKSYLLNSFEVVGLGKSNNEGGERNLWNSTH